MNRMGMVVVAVMFAVCMVFAGALLAEAKGKGQEKSVQSPVHHKEKGASKTDVQSSEMHQHKHKEKTVSSTPYGWSQGRKTGWRGGSYPPGWSKWDKKKQEEWRTYRVRSIEDIDTVLVRYQFPERQSSQIIGAFDQAIAGGMAIDDARRRLISGLKDSTTRRGLMIDAGKQALELLR